MLKHKRVVLAGLLCFLVSWSVQLAGNEQNEWVIIHAGKLLIEAGKDPLDKATLVIRSGRVFAIDEGYLQPDDLQAEAISQRVIDLSDFFVLPGLMDTHVHLGITGLAGAKLKMVVQSEADVAMDVAHEARQTLLNGFTTVRDLGLPTSNFEAIFAVRDAIINGKADGPRILAAGAPLSATGGHGDVLGYSRKVEEVLGSPAICNGTDDCRKKVREMVKSGADLIKIMVTGGIASEIDTGHGQQLSDEELAAIVKSAHMMNRKVSAHAHSSEGVIAAVRAGVDSIEHASYADEATLGQIKDAGIWLVPTVYPSELAAQNFEYERQHLPQKVVDKLEKFLGRPKATVTKAYNLGLKIALGSDAGLFPHGVNAHELVEYVDAGMSTVDALRSATVNSAELLGIDTDVGTLDLGKIADLIAVDGNPIEDISVLTNVQFVMRDGVVYREIE